MGFPLAAFDGFDDASDCDLPGPALRLIGGGRGGGPEKRPGKGGGGKEIFGGGGGIRLVGRAGAEGGPEIKNLSEKLEKKIKKISPGRLKKGIGGGGGGGTDAIIRGGAGGGILGSSAFFSSSSLSVWVSMEFCSTNTIGSTSITVALSTIRFADVFAGDVSC